MSKASWSVHRRQKLLGWSGDDSSGGWSTPSISDGRHGTRGRGSVAGLVGLIITDLVTCFAWAWGMHLAYAAYGDRPGSKAAVYIVGKFLFAWLSDLTGGGSTNPLTALTATSSAVDGRYAVVATVLFRVPAQVAGNAAGIWIFSKANPKFEPGPFLEADIYLGTVVQGVLAFTLAVVYLNTSGVGLFRQTFICTVTKLVLNLLGIGTTNGWLNPATAFGWAYLSGTHTTKEHIVVYWIAPVLATLLGVQLYDSFNEQQGSGNKWKSD